MDWNRADDLRALVQRLRGLTSENDWVEFKIGNEDPEAIGQYISSLSTLSNSAAGQGKWVNAAMRRVFRV